MFHKIIGIVDLTLYIMYALHLSHSPTFNIVTIKMVIWGSPYLPDFKITTKMCHDFTWLLLLLLVVLLIYNDNIMYNYAMTQILS